MTASDRIIADLVNALDAIQRKALSAQMVAADPSHGRAALNHIVGLASQAMVNCQAQQERNADGYLVVKGGR